MSEERKGIETKRKSQNLAAKRWIVYIVSRLWEERRGEGRKRTEKGGARERIEGGRVVEEDRAGGEGESKDSCADNHPVLTFVWAREVSKDNSSYRATVGVID